MSAIIPGDVISVVAEVKSATGADRMRVIVEQRGVTRTIQAMNATANTFTLASHGFVNGTIVQFEGELPTGFDDLYDYYVVGATTDTFQVSLTPGGAALDVPNTGAGTMEVFAMLGRAFGTEARSASYDEGRSYAENIEILPGFHECALYAHNMDDTETGGLRRVTAVRGPSATDYSEPVFLYNAHDASLLKYADGVAVEYLKPGEPGANVTETRTSLDTAHVDGIPSADVITQVNQALNDAALAQEAADREIVAFYQNTAPTGVGEKFGDIWIDTDASPFTAANAGHRYQNATGGSSGSLAWYLSPDNALVQLYFDAYNAQTTADGKIKTFFATTLAGLPTTGVSEGDLGFVTGEKATYRRTSGAWVVQSPKNVADSADVTAAHADLLAENPTFEGGSVGWGANSRAAVLSDPINARRGNYCLRLLPAGLETAFFNNIKFPVDAGDRFLAKAFFKGGSAGTGRVEIRYYDAAGNVISTATGSLVVAGSAAYLQSRVVSVAPANAREGQLLVSVRSNPTGTWYADDAFIVEVPRDLDIDALQTSNAPAMAGADATAIAGFVTLQNPAFEAGAVGWSGGAGWTITNDPANARQGNWCARRAGTGVSSSAGWGNQQFVPVSEGDRVYAHGFLKSTADVNALSYCRVRIKWMDAAGAQLSFSDGVRQFGPIPAYQQFRVLGTAPAGAALARAEFVVYDHSAGSWYADQMTCALFPRNSDIDALFTTNGPAMPGADVTGAHGTADLIGDTAGLGNSAHWSSIGGIPDTLAGHGITDAQTDLGPAGGDGYVLHRDSGGDTYWAEKFSTAEFNQGAWRPLSAALAIPNTGNYEPMGSRLVIPNPGRFVSLLYRADVIAVPSISTADIAWIVYVSLDGGATFAGAAHAGYMAVADRKMGSMTFLTSGTPTGDIVLELRCRRVSGTGTIAVHQYTTCSFHLLPHHEFSVVAGALNVTVPPSAAGSCSKTYPSTTCAASATVKAEPSGGTPPYSYSHAKVGGSDSITAGATSQTCTVSGTHTTADPAATYNTTISCTVVDDVASEDTSENCVVTLSYLRTFNPVLVSSPDKTFSCNGGFPGTCTAAGQLSRTASGGDGAYSDSWTKVSGDGSIFAGATTPTPSVNHSGSVGYNAYNTYAGEFRSTVTDGRSDSDSDDCTVTFRHWGIASDGP
jgi:hypothetical protein